MARKTSLCNDLLALINKECGRRPNPSFKSVAKRVGVKEATLSAWHRNFKTKKWPWDYSNTSDGEALSADVVRTFVDNFKSVGLKSRIVKRLLNTKCLKNPTCFSRQYGVLESLLTSYPNLDFWLYADFGGKVDDLLYLRGKNERILRKKYCDFNRKVDYRDIQFKEEYSTAESAPPSSPTTIWEFYEK